MVKLHQIVTGALILGLMVAIGRSPLQGRDAEDSQAALTPLGRVRAEPTALLGSSFSAIAQIDAWSETWNPYVTRFGAQDYRAISVWADEQLLWDPQSYAQPFGLLFVRRGSAAEAVLAQGKRFERFELRCEAAQLFLGRLWIEVVDARRLDEHVGEGSLLHAARAVALIAEQQWKLAEQDLDRALSAPLPKRAKAELERLQGLVRDAAKASGGA